MAHGTSKPRLRVLVLIAMGTLLVAVPARAEDFTQELRDLSIEELLNVDVVYGASKFEQKTADAPASVTIIHADEIRQMGYRTLGEALDGVRGLYVTWDRNYAFLGARGFNRPGDFNSRFLFLVDGHRVTEDVGGSAEIGRAFPVDLSVVERIEVIRGPGSVLYGTSAVFGVINVVTRHGASTRAREVAASAASYDTYEGSARFSGQMGDSAAVSVAGSYYRSSGQDLYFKEFDDPATNRGWAVGADGAHAQHGFANVSMGRLKVTVLASSGEKHIPTASYETVFNNTQSRTLDAARLVAATYEHRLPAGINLNGRVSYLDYEYKGWYAYDDDESPSGTVISLDGSHGRSVTGEIQLARRLLDRHFLTTGIEYRRAPTQDQFTDWAGEPQLDLHLSSATLGAYLQEEFRPGRGVILSVGARFDHYDDFGGTLNPRLAAIWNPSPSTGMKVLYGQAFRAPNAMESHYHDGNVTQKLAEDLDPERIRTLEVEVNRRVAWNVFLTLSGFSYRLHDLVTLTTDPSDGLLVYENRGRVKSSGAELELRRAWTSGITGHLSYGYQDARADLTDTKLSNAPKHMVRAAVVAPLRSGLSAGMDLRYTGSSRTVQGGTADGYLTTNLTLIETTLLPRLDLSLSVYNLFDERYAQPASEEHVQNVIPQDGRSARVTASFGF